MRVPNSVVLRTIRRNIEGQSQRLHEKQLEVGTGKRINRPSDDPYGAMRTQQLYSRENKLNQYERNANFAKTWLAETESAISNTSEIIMKMKELATQMASSQFSAVNREDSAELVDEMRDHLLALGNTKVGGRSIFAGYQTDSPAFLPDASYSGDNGDIWLHMDEQLQLNLNLTGDQVFQSDAAGKNAIETLEDFATALRNNDQNNVMTTVMDELNYAFDNLGQHLTRVGAKVNSMSTAQAKSEESRVQTKDQLGVIEEVDIVKAATEMQSASSAFEAALMSSAKIGKLSLVNFI